MRPWVGRVALSALVVAGACEGASAKASTSDARPKGWVPATMAHGISIEDSVGELVVECGDGETRTVAPRRGVQLVTLATPFDCSSCVPHIKALDTLSQAGELPGNELMVVWLPGGDAEAGVDDIRRETDRAVCIDRRGELWDRHDLQHTPVTVLLVDGRVTYMNDRLLQTPTEREAFLRDLAEHAR